jgi:thymidylate synthase
MDFQIIKTAPTFKTDWAVGWYKNANDAWQNLYYGLNVDGDIRSPRGLKVKETLGCDIYIMNPMDNLVYNSFYPASPYYIAQEYEWYHSYNNDVESIAKFAPFWRKIANPDGTVNSNYGCYIFKLYEDGTSEWTRLVDLLRKDPDSRQAILQIPITPFKNTKDLTCTSSLQFFVRDNKVFMTTYMRSNDLCKGFRNDIPFFTSLQIDLAKELDLEVGWYRHVVGNLHIYEPDFIENRIGEFRFECISEYKYPDSVREYDIKHDFNILRKRSVDGVQNSILKYMAENFNRK